MAINRYYRSNNSYGRNSQVSRVVAENARIQRINSYRSQIGQLNEQIDGFNTEIARLRREVERLRNFESDRRAAWGRFQSEHADRQRRLQGIQNFIPVSLSANKYHEGMNEDVNGGRMTQASSAVESSFSKITQAIRTREDRIQQLQSQIASLDGQIAALYQMIANA